MTASQKSVEETKDEIIRLLLEIAQQPQAYDNPQKKAKAEALLWSIGRAA